MAILMRMPEVSANVESAVIVDWKKSPGEAVQAGECLANIETDKAVIALAATEDGVFGRRLVAAGENVAVGTPVAVVLRSGEGEADVDALLRAEGLLPVDDEDTVPAQAAGAVSSAEQPPVIAPELEVATPASPAATRSDAPTGACAAPRPFASPVARRLAAERGVHLAALRGSGPGGRIVRRDVVSAQPHSRMREAIARRLQESKRDIPHFYLSVDCRVDALLALRREVNAVAAVRVTVNDFVVRAAALALKREPDLNVRWTDATLVRLPTIEVAVAVATDGGLITPIVRDAADKSLVQISEAIRELATRAHRGELQPPDYEGGSLTVSNLGMQGIRSFAAIINPPQAAILAVGAAEQRAVVNAEGALEAASMMTLTLSVDHRAVDGLIAARWLNALRHILEQPLQALI